MKRKVIVDYPFYKVVSDGTMSSPVVGEGRFIPALIIDVKENNEIIELINLHKKMPPGDIATQWSFPNTLFKPKVMYLNLEFSKPMRIEFGIEFNLELQHFLIDGIIQSQAFYLVTGVSGMKVSEIIHDSILIEAPNPNIDTIWNEMLRNIIRKRYKGIGAKKSEIKNYVEEHIESMRSFWNIRREAD